MIYVISLERSIKDSLIYEPSINKKLINRPKVVEMTSYIFKFESSQINKRINNINKRILAVSKRLKNLQENILH